MICLDLKMKQMLGKVVDCDVCIMSSGATEFISHGMLEQI